MRDPYRTAADFMIGSPRPNFFVRLWRLICCKLLGRKNTTERPSSRHQYRHRERL